MIKKIGMISLGCPKNQVDSEVMLGLLTKAGYQLVNDPNEADAIIINTCGFIESAKEESVEVIVEYADYKNSGNCKLLIVTGCMAQRYSQELIDEIPEIDIILGTGNYVDLVSAIDMSLQGARTILTADLNRQQGENLPRILTTPSHTAYLKISEGCDNHCSYCIIPKLRGSYRSRPIDGLLREANYLLSNGVREIILVGQDITRYGNDMEENVDLIKLLGQLVELEGLKWVRLLYCYPDRITDSLLELIAIQPKICNYLDIPLQHINAQILKRMNRHFSPDQIKSLLIKIRDKIPDIVLRTSFIVGFPGERELEFDQLMGFLEEFSFNRAGVFAYSSENGTVAAEFKDQVHEDIKEDRKSSSMALQQKISKKMNRKRLNEICEVLIEDVNPNGVYVGRSYGEAPGIDGQIFISSLKTLKKGEFINVKITKAYEYDLFGEIYEPGK